MEDSSHNDQSTGKNDKQNQPSFDSGQQLISQDSDTQREEQSNNSFINTCQDKTQEMLQNYKTKNKECVEKEKIKESAQKDQEPKAYNVVDSATNKKNKPNKKEYKDELKKIQSVQNQRQSKIDSKKLIRKQQSNLSKIKKQESKKQIEKQLGDQWTINDIESDNQDAKINEEGQEQNQDQQKTAFIEEDQINNLTSASQQNQLNNACIQKDVSLKYEHWVENKHLLVLYLLFRKDIYDQFPKKQYHRIDIHPSNKNKIRIFGTNSQQIKQVSTKISETINKIAIVKLNIRREEATRLKSSKLLNRKLLKDKLVIFSYGNAAQRSYYLGGKGTQPQLSMVIKEIRNLKFRYFRMFDYKNTRSYSLMLNYFIKQKQLLKAFVKQNLKNIELVPFIPNFGHGPKRDKQKNLCFLMTTVGNVENFSPKEIENNLGPFIRNTFYSVNLIFKQCEKYLPKLSVQGIYFRYVFEKKCAWAYVYIMSLKKEFFAKRQEIIREIEKLAEKNVIFGVRYFDNIAPSRSEYIKQEIYKEVKFPQNDPYSTSIIARRIYAEKLEPSNEQKEKKENEDREEKHLMKERQEKTFYVFDWKEHLMSLQPIDASFIEQRNE